MKKTYVKPSLEAMVFEDESVITTSGVIGRLDSADEVVSSAWRSDWNQ